MPVRYITVTPVTNMFKPVERSFGDVAIVGTAVAAAAGPEATPIPVTNPDDVSFQSLPGNGNPIDSPAWFEGDLGTSIRLCFSQAPGPSKVYAVRPGTGANALADALAEVAKLPVQIIALANVPLSAAGGTPEIEALAAHVNTVSNTGGDGKERIGVAMLDKAAVDASAITGNMTSDRMVFVAHRSDQDAAAAVAGTIAGYEPHISLLLKQVNIGMDTALSDAEIDVFDGARVNWLADPFLLPGKGVFMGEGYTTGVDLPYIDIVRTIDDISFRLKARLIRSIGTLRISRSGLRVLASQMSAVLEPLKVREVIEEYAIVIPVLTLLDKDPASLTAAELQQIQNAQNDRIVAALVSVDYAGAIHRLNITLKFE